MALLQIQFYSEALDVASSVNVIFPEPNQGIGLQAAKEHKLPGVLYLLHGYSDDHTTWTRRTSIERYAAACNLAVIMPAVSHSFYCNERWGERYWDYVSQELPRTMHRFLQISDRPEDTFVAGQSMGGYGAMRLALTYPERYAAAACFSGAVDVSSIIKHHEEGRMPTRILGDNHAVKDTELDLFYLMKKNGSQPRKPVLYVSCGTKDSFYVKHQTFVPALIENGWDVHRHDEEGADHEWGFWDQEIRKFLDRIC